MGMLDRLTSLRRDGIYLTSPLLGSQSPQDQSREDIHRLGERHNDEIISTTTALSSKRRSSILSLSSFTRSKTLILAIITFSLLLALVAFTPTDIDASNLKALHADLTEKIASKWKQATGGKTPVLSTSQSQGLDRSWDFYAQNGIFVNGRTNNSIPQNRKARFIPVEYIDKLAEENKSGLEGDLKLGDGFDEISKYGQVVNHKSESAFSDISYLQNKTVLLIGDSIDRFSLDFTCRSILYGSSLTYRELHHEPHDLSAITRGGNDLDEFSEPHRCALRNDLFPNTSIWSLMVYGVTSEEEEWAHKAQTLHPRKYDDKIRFFAEKFKALNNSTLSPDLIIVNTVLWDLATFNLRDARAEIAAQEWLSWSYLKEFRDKTIHLMGLIDELWPEAAKMYRPNHAMRHGSDGVWFLQGLRPMPKSIARAPYMPNKVLQLNQIIDDLLANQMHTSRSNKKTWWPFDVRHVMQEYVLDFQDSVHTGSLGRTIYAQMLAYYIKMLT